MNKVLGLNPDTENKKKENSNSTEGMDLEKDEGEYKGGIGRGCSVLYLAGLLLAIWTCLVNICRLNETREI